MKFMPEKADFVINRLSSRGYEAYIVGGAVRDMLMGIEPDDTDITTNALPEETEEIFSDTHVIETGIKHGTVTAVVDGTPIEITTFRTEEGYSDGRHPDKVTFTSSIEEDLSRRDFTMNSIAYNPTRGLVDPYSGRQDIENRIIRCVGNPRVRFTEDSLRILRAMRFSSVLGFKIEDETEKAMLECKNLLKNVSEERIYSELCKMLCGKNIKQVIMSYCDIFAVIIPEIGIMKNFNQHNFHHKYDLLEHTAVVTENIDPVIHLRLAALLHDIAKPYCMSFDENGIGHFYKHPSIGAAKADTILKNLRADNKTREKVIKLIKWHDTPIEESEKIIKKKLRSMGEEMLYELIKLKQADTMGLADEYRSRLPHFERLRNIVAHVIEEEQCFSLKDLAVNGNDIISLGLKGRQIGKALNFALESVIDDVIKNEKKALINLITENADSF